MLEIILTIFIAWIAIAILFPRAFQKRCGYCGKRHRNGYEYKLEGVNKVFGSKECGGNWSRENYICAWCSEIYPIDDSITIQHKYKGKNIYYCSTEHKELSRKENPNLFFEGHKRHGIPTEIRKIVFNRDGGKCVKCGSDKNIEYDHIIPVSKGGSNTEQNIELLCQDCNRSKSDKIE